ncbi:MAG: hypothetical protein PQJ59_17125 [Spirochaetales bacterium]|nr:hypothetical protein [Spirochaetales bacterium]
MFGFLIKKSFWDFWDKMGLMILMNLTLMLIGAGAVYLFVALYELGMVVPAFAVFVLFGALFFLILGAHTRACTEVINNRSFSPKAWYGFLKEKAKKSLLFYVLVLGFSVVIYTAMNFYGSVGGHAIFLGAFFFMFWVTLFLLFAAGYFFPLSNIMDDPFGKNIKKCFVLFFDNSGVSIGASLLGTLLFSLSFLTAFLVPGVSAAVILWENLMKLLMLKYDYLEENPEADKKKIPWVILLRDERENLGERGFRDMIRPWK